MDNFVVGGLLVVVIVGAFLFGRVSAWNDTHSDCDTIGRTHFMGKPYQCVPMPEPKP